MFLKHYEPTAGDCAAYDPDTGFTVDTLESVTRPDCVRLASSDAGHSCDHGDPCACYVEGFAAGKEPETSKINQWLNLKRERRRRTQPCAGMMELTIRLVAGANFA